MRNTVEYFLCLTQMGEELKKNTKNIPSKHTFFLWALWISVFFVCSVFFRTENRILVEESASHVVEAFFRLLARHLQCLLDTRR